MNPVTDATRTILPSRFVHRSNPTDQRAYKFYLHMNMVTQKWHEEIQRRGAERSQKIKHDEADAANLADGLTRHDTNTLNRARALLWINNDAYVIAVNRLTAAHWDEADNLVNDFILHGTNVLHQCRVLQRVTDYCPDRFSNALVQIGSDLSSTNGQMLGIAIPGLGRIHDSRADSCLVAIALKYPNIHIQYEALSFLFPRNRALYSQTLQQLSSDKDFMAYYTKLHLKAASSKQ